MNATDRARLWRVSRALAVAVAVMGAQPVLAIETNPFLPPAERGDDMEARLQKRIDRAVAAAEERLVKTVVDALSGRDISGAPKPLQDAVARRPPPAVAAARQLSNLDQHQLAARLAGASGLAELHGRPLRRSAVRGGARRSGVVRSGAGAVGRGVHRLSGRAGFLSGPRRVAFSG
jgi:ribosomal protein L12E/L44/L45/RPP1/RPP2